MSKTNEKAQMSKGTVYQRKEGPLATITFFHPKDNSLPSDMLRGLRESFCKAGTGCRNQSDFASKRGDSSFCGGASFDELWP